MMLIDLCLVPVCIRPPHPQNLQTTLPTVRMIVDVSKAVALLSTSSMIKLLKCKEASIRAWPTILDVDDVPSSAKRRAEIDNPDPRLSSKIVNIVNVCLELMVNSYIIRAGPNLSKCGCYFSVYSGHHSILIPPSEVEQNPALWLTAVSQHKVRDTFCSYGVMELCVRELAPQIAILKEKGVSLSCVRTCVVVAEERPRVPLCTAFTKLFSPLGLNARAVSTSFGCRVNTAICMQGAASPDPATVYVDARALRNDRVTLVEKGAPHSIALMESGKLLPGPHNAAGYFTVYGDEASLHTDHFNARLLHDAVFVVGALDETMMLRGMRYHPVDIEASYLQHIFSAVFTWTHLLVVVAETEGSEMEALDLIPAITSAVLEEHHLIVGVVVIVDPGTVPINSRGEKQRMHLRDAFFACGALPICIIRCSHMYRRCGFAF
uniref:AMP-dependent synthetase/ligase domain-containing protein n=1 Tax=Parascaris equorum TaxID=6256 RepID=A0A914RIS8_PAREQ